MCDRPTDGSLNVLGASFGFGCIWQWAKWSKWSKFGNSQSTELAAAGGEGCWEGISNNACHESTYLFMLLDLRIVRSCSKTLLGKWGSMGAHQGVQVTAYLSWPFC